MQMDIDQYQFGDHEVRVIAIDGQPWWVAADVGRVLQLGNFRSSLAALDDDEIGVHSMDGNGGSRDLSVISESGLFSLILRSRRPEAKAFKKWVTSEVLPSIRRTGSYQVAPVVTTTVTTTMTTRLAEVAHREHVVPAAGAILAHHRWNHPEKGMMVMGSLCVQLELDYRPLDGPTAITA